MHALGTYKLPATCLHADALSFWNRRAGHASSGILVHAARTAAPAAGCCRQVLPELPTLVCWARAQVSRRAACQYMLRQLEPLVAQVRDPALRSRV